MEGNPYSSPREVPTADVKSGVLASRFTGALLSALCGVPLAGVLSYLLFGSCAGIGNRMMSDETYFDYSPSMFLIGAAVAIVPSLLCGILNPQRAVATCISAHVIGVALGAFFLFFVALDGFRWQFVMATYFLVVLLLPVVVSAVRRLT